MNNFKNLGKLVGPQGAHFLNPKPKATPLTFNPVGPATKPPPLPAVKMGTPTPSMAPKMPMQQPPSGAPPVGLGGMANAGSQPPPQTQVNSVPNVNHISNNLSRITKVQKLDHFPRLYRTLKS